jgi:hypothetical protein
MPSSKRTTADKSATNTVWVKFLHSVWLFPALLTIALILLTILRISGSSIGSYQAYFYGNTKDQHLILNQPQAVRSDEWLVNTQMTIAQSNNHYNRINHNIGQGEDMSVTLDVPYKDWSELFKPHNWVFFVLPFEYAFAFKWWLMAYLLVLGCYFFILALLPHKRLLATLISLSLLFSSFVQWWYQYITIGPIYYTFFIGIAVIYLLKQRRLLYQALLATLLAYLVTCFALVLYPPFQIPCALAMGVFLAGYLLEKYPSFDKRDLLKKIGLMAAALIVAGLIVIAFVETRSDVINTVSNTVYPGKRLTRSGGFSWENLLSGELGHQFLSITKAAKYHLGNAPVDQSESSNFILLLPFLFLPSLYILRKDYRRGKGIDWPLLLVNGAFIVFLLQLFAKWFEPFSKLLLLDRVPDLRLLIGLGFLNILQIILIIRHFIKEKTQPLSNFILGPYILLVFAIELSVGIYAKNHYPGFIGHDRVLVYALPVPVIVYLLLRKRFVLAMTGFLAFSLFTSFQVNPLYQGTAIVTQNPIDSAIKTIAAHSSGRWIAENIYLENFPAMNGAPSLSGVYYYPQFGLWDKIPNASPQVYNRYAHVGFITEESSPSASPTLQLIGGDHFVVYTGICSSYLHQENVRYVLTTSIITDSCVQKIKTISLPANTFYIYHID